VVDSSGSPLHGRESVVSFKKVLLTLTLVVACGEACGVLPDVLTYAFSCAYRGRWTLRRSQDPRKMPLGSTTDEVRAEFGEPHGRAAFARGEIWYYYPGGFDASIYKLVFDEKGRLVDACAD
jgi:hypothetical protein